jgi:hypothetical protein
MQAFLQKVATYLFLLCPEAKKFFNLDYVTLKYSGL